MQFLLLVLFNLSQQWQWWWFKIVKVAFIMSGEPAAPCHQYAMLSISKESA